MHAHPDVTEWLARGSMSIDEADDAIARFEAHFDVHGFGLWAVERRADAMLIGLCGLSHEARTTHPMAPCVEIVWRQARPAWGQGCVAEAATAALVDRFDRIGLGEIFAWTADTDLRSQHVMQRLGMQRQPGARFRSSGVAGRACAAAAHRVCCAPRRRRRVMAHVHRAVSAMRRSAARSCKCGSVPAKRTAEPHLTKEKT